MQERIKLRAALDPQYILPFDVLMYPEKNTTIHMQES